jgi:predicted nucleic acid-binding Zn ribbon protein
MTQFNEDSTLNDRELPDESDMDPDESDPFADTEPCPLCGKPIHEDADICHHCGKYVSRSDRSGRTWTVIVIGVALCLAIVLGYWVI